MGYYQSLQSSCRILNLTMQAHQSKGVSKEYLYDFPLRPSHPHTRRTSLSPAARPSKPSSPQHQSSSYLKVLEAEEYSTLEMTMQLKLKNLQENIKICRQKSKIKDREMQSLAELIGKLSKRMSSEESLMKKKERQLQSISTKCQEMASRVSQDQDRIKNEMVYLAEETDKFTSLQEATSSLQEAIKEAECELERKQKICESLEAMEAENSALKDHYNQLLNEEKLIEYREHHEKSECEDMEKKIEQLGKVLRDRTKINKNNSSKLAKLAKEVQMLEGAAHHKRADASEIKSLELDIGDLNQELLLINDEIAQFQFKIKRKQHGLEELKAKLHHFKSQSPLPIQSAQKEENSHNTLKSHHPHPNNIPGLSPQEIQQKGASNQGTELAHQTPTFPSNFSNQIYFNSEPPKGQSDGNDRQAFRNIQKLIKRYEQIKSKDKSGE